MASAQPAAPALDLRGTVSLDLDGAPVSKRYVLRAPDAAVWNGVLVVGAHGGMGGNNYSRDGRVIGTDETALDDVVGTFARARNFAYASMDRDGIGGTRQGLQLTYAFTDLSARMVSERLGRSPERVYIVGLSMGGGIARYAVEDPKQRYAGAVLVAGGAGDVPTRLERQAQLARLWPDIDPRAHPSVADTDAKVRAFAAAIGTPAAARPLWPFASASATLANVRKSLDQYGVTGLTDDEVLGFRVAAHQSNPVLNAKLREENTTGRVRVPTIEVVGTWDDIVLREVQAYKAKVLAQTDTSPDRHRLYQVEGVWHMSNDDDGVASFQFIATKMGLGADVADAMGSGPSYLPTVRDAFELLHEWVTTGTAPPPDRTLAPGAPLR